MVSIQSFIEPAPAVSKLKHNYVNTSNQLIINNIQCQRLQLKAEVDKHGIVQIAWYLSANAYNGTAVLTNKKKEVSSPKAGNRFQIAV